MRIKTAILTLFLIISLIFLRGLSMGAGVKDTLLVGLIFPAESRILEDHSFKSGDELVIYRISCPDCKRYILKLRWVLKKENAYYLTDTNRAQNDIAVSWVPSVVIFSDDNKEVFEIKNERDIGLLERCLKDRYGRGDE